MTAHDVALVGAAALVLLVPGAVVLWLATGRVAVVLAGAAATTIGIGYLSGLLTGFAGLSWGPVAFGLVWLAVVVGVGLVRGRKGWGGWVTPHRPSALTVVGASAVLGAMAIGVRTFLNGLGGLATVPQEHDMVLHTVVVANIARTGRGAPWQAFPVDLLSGSPSSFYPNGFHQFAALLTHVTGDPVSALNAAMTAIATIALPLGVAALGWLLRPRSLAPVVGGASALVAVVAYRPVIALLHDGGILANTMALSLAPGVLAVVLLCARLGLPGVLPLVLAATGAVAVHPTNIATVGVSAVIAVVVTSFRPEPGQIRRTVTCLVPAGVLTAVFLLPFVASGGGSASGVAAFPRDVGTNSLREALGTTLSQPYGGFLDPGLTLSQTWIVVLSGVGVLACLLARANAWLVLALGTWAAVLVAYLMDVQSGPLQVLTGLYYNSYVRLSGVLALFQWLASGVAVAGAVWLVVRAGRLVRARWPGPGRGRGWRAPVTVAASILALASVVWVVCLPYAQVNASALSERYSNPGFIRVDGDDLAAARYVADRIGPGQRVMNNANDGSTYGYVYYGLPIVLNLTLGSGDAPYTIDLLSRFDELGEDRTVTEEVCRLDIAWVIADAEAPPIWAPEETFSWVDGGSLATPPGFEDLEDVPALSLSRVFGDVSVYQVDLGALGCAER